MIVIGAAPIVAANASSGPDDIHFNVGGGGVQTLTGTISTAMYVSGVDPYTKQAVHVARVQADARLGRVPRAPPVVRSHPRRRSAAPATRAASRADPRSGARRSVTSGRSENRP